MSLITKQLKFILTVNFFALFSLLSIILKPKISNKLFILVLSVIILSFIILWRLTNKIKNYEKRNNAGRLVLIWVLINILLLSMVYNFDVVVWIGFKLTGNDITLKEDFQDIVNIPVNDFLEQNRIFSRDRGNSSKIVLKKGVYDIDNTIIIPRGTHLVIEPGTILRFKIGRSLISYSPITAVGGSDEPIQFAPKNKWLRWGSVGLVHTGKSVFKNVRFERGSRALINNREFYGSLNFHQTDTEITNSQFSDLFGEDGVHVREGNVVIKDNLFRDTFGDCLDIDGAKGIIAQNQFLNCGDEGIDISLNYDLDAFDNVIVGARGLSISADNDLERIRGLNLIKE